MIRPLRTKKPATRTVHSPAAAPSKKTTSPARKRALARKRAAERDATNPDAAKTTKTQPALSGRAARYLRGLGHHLDPVVHIGKEGISERVVEATRTALLAHELIKVKVLAECPVDRKEAGEELARRSGAALAQTLGRTLLLYKRHPNKPKLVLPR